MEGMVGKYGFTNPNAWRAGQDLAKVVQNSGTIYASGDVMFKFAFFGRDSLEVADDLLMVDPTVARRLLPRLAELQGIETNPLTEEEPGKIHHEHRELIIDGKRIPRKSRQILGELADRWGLDDRSFTYYGAADTTPLYARVLSRFSAIDASILYHHVETKDGEVITMADSLQRALDFIVRQIGQSACGLLEFKHQNRHGLISQIWKDSVTALQHADGKVANYHKPVATVDLQALAFDALVLGAQTLSKTNLVAPQTIDDWRQTAEELRLQTLRRFWLGQESRFATGQDYDESDQPRLITTPTSGQGIVLNSEMLTGISEVDREMYVMGTLGSLLTRNFVTDVGIRCRSLDYLSIVNFEDYHGAWAVWPKETYDVAAGLRSQGLIHAADQLERRILYGTSRGGNRELFYVAPDGAVAWRLLPVTRLHRKLPIRPERIIHATNIPESPQAWTSSAVFAMRMRRRHARPAAQVEPTTPLGKLERQLIAELPPIPTDSPLKKVIQTVPTTDDVFFIDVKTGLAKQRQWEEQFTK